MTTRTTGDLNGNRKVDSDDAIYLLMATLFPKDYPIDNVGDCDFDGDGNLSSDDAIYLLMNTLFPKDYPLVKKQTEAIDLPVVKI